MSSFLRLPIRGAQGVSCVSRVHGHRESMSVRQAPRVRKHPAPNSGLAVLPQHQLTHKQTLRGRDKGNGPQSLLMKPHLCQGLSWRSALFIMKGIEPTEPLPLHPHPGLSAGKKQQCPNVPGLHCQPSA